MTEYVFMNGQFIEADKASLPVRTHAFLYGTSVFEGIRAYYNKDEDQLYAFRMKEHYERLFNSCKIFHMDPKYTIDEYIQITKDLLKKNDYHTDVYIRPNVYKSAQKIGPGLYDNEDSVLIFSFAFGDYIDTSNGLKVCVSNWRRVDDNSIPPRAKVAGSYANTALIKTDAHNMGFDDAIVLSQDGTVTEGSAMNFFIVQKGKLITTRTTDNILEGITRNTVLEIAKKLNIETVERDIDRTELYVSDEAFYCGTGAQISPITSIDNRPLGDGKIGPVSRAVQNLYFDVVKGRVEEYKKWCTPVYD